ncbi:MAG: hypothetical protein H7Z21_04640 [Hymenobacter sp.]|nr:hypothetical protein [Hymenobacter sp.]
MLRFTNFLRVLTLLGLLVVGAANRQPGFHRQPLRRTLRVFGGEVAFQASPVARPKQVRSSKGVRRAKETRQL